MKLLAKATAVVALACVLAPAVHAQTYPQPPAPGGSNLILTVWDPNAGVSLVYAIPGLVYQSVRDGLLVPGSYEIPQFASTFGSDLSAVRWHVSAFGLTGVNDGFTNDVRGMYTTGPTPAMMTNNTSGNVSGQFTNAGVFHAALESECGDAVVCIAGNLDGAYGDNPIWGDFPQTQFQPSGSFGTGGVDAALTFWDITQIDASRIRPTDPATTTAFAGGFAQWLLGSDGILSYSVVPLPAAAWLLLSGLVGFGAISRRRRQAAA